MQMFMHLPSNLLVLSSPGQRKKQELESKSTCKIMARVLGQVTAALFLIQLPDTAGKAARDSPSTWVTATNRGNSRVSSFQPGSPPCMASIWGMNQ